MHTALGLPDPGVVCVSPLLEESSVSYLPLSYLILPGTKSTFFFIIELKSIKSYYSFNDCLTFAIKPIILYLKDRKCGCTQCSMVNLFKSETFSDLCKQKHMN